MGWQGKLAGAGLQILATGNKLVGDSKSAEKQYKAAQDAYNPNVNYIGGIMGDGKASFAQAQPAPGNNNQQSDPAQQTPGGGGGGGGGGYNYGYGSGSTAPDVSAFDQAIAALRAQLGGHSAAYQGALSSNEANYNADKSNAELAHNRAQAGYDTQQQDTQNSKNAALNRVDTNARTLANSIRSILGMAAGSNSSAYQITAPGAVAREASQQRTGVLGDYGQNERDIQTARDQEKTDFERLLENLSTRLRQQNQAAQQSKLQGEISTFGQLADNSGKRSAALGGSASSGAQPYMNEINARQAELNNILANPINAVAVNPVVANTPSLREYITDRAAINAEGQAGEKGQYNPFSYFLKQKQQEQGV